MSCEEVQLLRREAEQAEREVYGTYGGVRPIFFDHSEKYDFDGIQGKLLVVN